MYLKMKNTAAIPLGVCLKIKKKKDSAAVESRMEAEETITFEHCT